MLASELIKILGYAVEKNGNFEVRAKVKDYKDIDAETIFGDDINQSINMFKVPHLGDYGYLEFAKVHPSKPIELMTARELQLKSDEELYKKDFNGILSKIREKVKALKSMTVKEMQEMVDYYENETLD